VADDTSKPGRPTEYTEELADRICAELAETANLRAVCRQEGMPSESTVRRWAIEDREGFSARYARARTIGYMRLADDVLEISDDSSGDAIVDPETGVERINTEFVARSRIRVDTRKWLLSKVLPKLFGDKVALTGEDGGPIKHEVTCIQRVIVDVPPERGE
jgi:transposase-like protein